MKKFIKRLLAFWLTMFAVSMAWAAMDGGNAFTYVFAAILLAASARVWWLLTHPAGPAAALEAQPERPWR
jgi:hypothetical protein